MRWSVAVVVALVVLLVAPPAVAQPTFDVARLPGLDYPARMVQDRDGIRHLRAVNRHDLFFLQGWAHAEDRLFQMDLSRRQASGTLAEVLGPDALRSDVELRTFGLRRAAERSYEVVSPKASAVLAAYAEGVNAWVEANPLPDQYGALQLTRFEPWTPVDSLVISKLITFGLSFDLDIEPTLQLQAYQRAGAAQGFDGTVLYFQDAFRSAPYGDASTVPDALGRRYLERANQVPILRDAIASDSDIGSNEWAVSGERSASGRPLLANDPHLALDTPSTFYPIHLQAGRLDVSGEGFAGIPGVILGQNDYIAWGSTTNPMDVTDTYAEQVVADPNSPSGLSTTYQGALEPIQPIPQVFRANNPTSPEADDVSIVPAGDGIPPVTLIVPRRNNGPILELDEEAGTALSVQYTGFGATREIEVFLAFDEARNLEDFTAALQLFDVGSQNWAYVDREGTIAYFTSAEMPLREDLQAGTVDGLPPYFIRDGTGGNEWLPATTTYPGQAIPYEILPPEEMPQLVNPPAGFFVNANNDPAGTTLDNDPLNQLRPGGGIFYLNYGYDGFRAERVTQRLEAEFAGDGTVSFADMQSIQADTVLLDAQVFVPLVVGALERARSSEEPALAALAADPAVVEAAGRLAAWDGGTPTDSIAATIYSVWRGQFIANTVDATLGGLGLPSPDGQRSLSVLRLLLENFEETGGAGASGVNFFAVDGVADPADRRDVLALRSLADALALLSGPEFAPAFGGSSDQDDYVWGRLHRVVLDSPLGGPFDIPPAGGAFPPPLPDLDGIPTDGGFGVVDASNHDARADAWDEFTFGSGPVRRYVAEAWPDKIRAVSSLPGGTSERLGSPYYANLLPGWLANETYPVRRSPRDVLGAAAAVTVFLP